MSLPAIRVENLGKRYKLGLTHAGTLRELVNHATSRLLRRQDVSPRPLAGDGQGVSAPGANGNGQAPADAKEFWALKDVSFEVQPGEVLGVIGRNGAGKSTLLKILSRVTSPTNGRVELNGRVASLLEVGTGFHPELTGRENVYLNGAILGMTKPEIRRKFDEIVAFAGVEKFIDTPVKRYSSGMNVRLAFAVAAHLDPEVLIIDEVLAVGDAGFQERCLGKMDEVASAGRTVLFVSHNMNAVRHLCSKAMLLTDGQVEMIGDTGDAIEKYLEGVLESSDPKTLPPGYLYHKTLDDVDGDYAITGVQLLDEAGAPLNRLRTWHFVDFRIHYWARRQLPRGSVVLQVFTPEQAPLILTSTQPDRDVPCPIQAGSGVADCVFHRWPLASGRYILGAGLAIPGVHFVCHNKHLCELIVDANDVFGTGLPPSSNRYLVAVDHDWSLPA